MRDPITDAAQDPSCLLCLTPDRGGSWWSRLRPPTPRDFKEERMTFTDSYTAQDGIGADDFTLYVDFTLLRNNAHGEINIGCLRCAYYDTTKGHQPSVQILKTDGTKGLFYPVGTMHITGDIVGIKVIKVGQNVRMVVYASDGSTVKDMTKPLPDGATVTSSSGATVYPGNIFAASIRNDTTGEIVWQAAYSDLYDTSNPWPSPVPENFAEKAKAFYDCQAAVREALDPTHDYSFLIEAEIVRENPECSMFYAGGDKFPFGVYAYSDNTIRVFSNLLRPAGDTSSKYVTVVAYSGDTRLQGRHAIEVIIEGDTMHAFLDGNEIAHQYKTVRTGTAAVGLPNCNSGYVYKIQITDLTDNQVVWSYPSEAERVRLITKTNVRTDRGAFEAADETATATIATQLSGTPTALLAFTDDWEVITGATMPDGVYTLASGRRLRALLGFDRALSAAEIAALTPKKQPLSWAGIRDVVRRGRAQRYFAVGDVLTIATPRWTIEYEVTGFDQVEPADAALTHSMTLLPVRLVTHLQFDAPEPGNPDANRAQYGCNRWDWSAIRQWLNSAAAPGEWWTAQHEYDAAPAYAATLAGFMADLPADFLSAVAPARLMTALSNAYGGGSVETVDRFWLPSRTEIFGDANNGVAEGVLMAKYVDATDADRIKQNGNGAADRWRLRSANLSQAHSVYLVSSDGTFFVAGHGAAVVMGIVPACIIA